MQTRRKVYARIWDRLGIAEGKLSEALTILGGLPDLDTRELMLQRALQHAITALSEASQDIIGLQKSDG